MPNIGDRKADSPMSESRLLGQIEADLKNLKEAIQEIKMRQKELEAWRIEHSQKEALLSDGPLPGGFDDQGNNHRNKFWKDKLSLAKQLLIVIAIAAAAITGVFSVANSLGKEPLQVSKEDVLKAITEAQKSIVQQKDVLPVDPNAK